MSSSQVHAPRYRVSVACLRCRTKRSRCDGQQPHCGRCLQDGQECTYTFDAERRKPPSKRYVQALQARIDDLEQQLSQYQQVDAALDIIDPITSDEGQSPVVEEDKLSTNNDDPVDNLTNLYGHLRIAEDGQLRYFGAPSYFNLPRRQQYDTQRESAYSALPTPTPSAHISIQQVTGLDAEVQNHLMSLYWTWSNPWHYFIHKKAFCRALDRDRFDAYCTPLLIHAVFALCARYSDDLTLRTDPSNPSTAGNLLAERAKQLFAVELQRPTTSTVVACLLLALRAAAANMEALAWSYSGLCTRIAYNLGLHLNCQSWVRSSDITEEEAEIRNITWGGCYLLDHLYSVALGRPGIIQERDVSALKASLLPETEFSSWELQDGEKRISFPYSRCVSNLHYTCEIFRITSNTLAEIYASNSNWSLGQKKSLAIKTYATLCSFYNKVPSFMRLPVSMKTALPPHMYQFHLQYHVAIILLHRPFLHRHNTYPLYDLSTMNGSTHNEACTSSAQMISTIFRAYRDHYTLRRIPISAVHGCGIASVIHLANATSDDPVVCSSAMRLLKFNITCLDEMSIAWQWSCRAIRALQILAEEWRVVAASHEVSSFRDDSEKQKESYQSSTDMGVGLVEDQQHHHRPQPADFLSLAEDPLFPPASTTTIDYAPDREQLQTSQQPLEMNMDWLMAYNTGDFMDGSMNDMILTNELLGFNLYDILLKPHDGASQLGFEAA